MHSSNCCWLLPANQADWQEKLHLLNLAGDSSRWRGYDSQCRDNGYPQTKLHSVLDGFNPANFNAGVWVCALAEQCSLGNFTVGALVFGQQQALPGELVWSDGFAGGQWACLRGQ